MWQVKKRVTKNIKGAEHSTHRPRPAGHPTLSDWVASCRMRASTAAATRLLAAVMAWMSPVRWRLNWGGRAAFNVAKNDVNNDGVTVTLILTCAK